MTDQNPMTAFGAPEDVGLTAHVDPGQCAGMYAAPVNDPDALFAKRRVNQFCVARIVRFA